MVGVQFPNDVMLKALGMSGCVRRALGWMVFVSGLAVSVTGGLVASEPALRAEDLPRVAPKSPQEALGLFRVRPGFRVELVVGEPGVESPVAMAFDERERLYVVEMRDYPEERGEKLGRIRLLEDRDGDGVYETSKVFLEGLPWPTAVACWGGGVFVAATPDLLYARDTNGDGVADEVRTVATGLASGYAPYAVDKLNVQALVNSLQVGLDGWIHGSASMNGGRLEPAGGGTGQGVDLGGVDFALAGSRGAGLGRVPGWVVKAAAPGLESLRLVPETGGGQHGMSFDDAGRKFVCSNSDHLQEVVYDRVGIADGVLSLLPGARQGIAVDGPAAEVYRISPDEPWRVVRTRWRVSGLVPGMIEGGGRPSGYFTAATGITVYRGDAFPEAFRGDVFVADCGSNLIHRKRLSRAGVLLSGERAEDERDREFLASTDNWFRPVQMANGPDGALYVVDMYRETIEHPWSIPPGMKKLLDLTSGRERGRIWRVVPEGWKRPRRVNLAKASVTGLVEALGHVNAWQRETAGRLLVERWDAGVERRVEDLFQHSPKPLARLHAYGLLEGGAVGESVPAVFTRRFVRALQDTNAAVRLEALRFRSIRRAGFHGAGSLPTAFGPGWAAAWDAMRALASDPDPEIRFHLALALGQVPAGEPGRVELLAGLCARDLGDSWVSSAATAVAGKDSVGFLSHWLAQREVLNLAGGRRVAGRLLGRVHDTEGRETMVSALLGVGDRRSRWRLLGELRPEVSSGLRVRGWRDAALESRWREEVGAAIALVGDRSAELPARAEAAGLLRFATVDQVGATGPAGLGAGESGVLQLATARALEELDSGEVARWLLGAWAGLRLEARQAGVEVMLRRPVGALALLKAVESGAVVRRELSVEQEGRLRGSRDAAVRQKAEAVLGVPVAQRAEVLDAFVPALALKGDVAKGKALFKERCSTCHRMAGEGNTVGPDLASVRSNGAEKLLVGILDPNREVAPNYVAWTAELKDGETVSGILVSETASEWVLREAGGRDRRLPRETVNRLDRSSNSLMPVGLEQGLKPADLADLLAFLMGS